MYKQTQTFILCKIIVVAICKEVKSIQIEMLAAAWQITHLKSILAGREHRPCTNIYQL